MRYTVSYRAKPAPIDRKEAMNNYDNTTSQYDREVYNDPRGWYGTHNELKPDYSITGFELVTLLVMLAVLAASIPTVIVAQIVMAFF